MTQVTPIRDLKGYLEPAQVEKLIAAAANLRDALLVRIPWRSGIRVSELIGYGFKILTLTTVPLLSRCRRCGRVMARRLREEEWFPLTKVP